MSIFTIKTNATGFLSNNESVVYAGKNGFTTEIGTIPVLCTAVSSNAGSISLTVSNINQLVDDNYMVNVLEVPSLIGLSNPTVKVPFKQYPTSTKQQGSIAYYDNFSEVSLPISSYNISSNTVVVANQPYSDSLISSLLPSVPFYINLYQPITPNNFSNRSAYVSGSFLTKKKVDNVRIVVNSFYTMELPIIPLNTKFIELYLDGEQSNNYTWNNSNAITFPLFGTTSEARVVVSRYTVPALERLDSVTLSTFNNNYSITNTSYQVSDALYDSSLTNSGYFKIRLNRNLSVNSTGQSIVNITPDFEGKTSNVTPTSFDIAINNRNYLFTYELANNKVYYLYQKDKVQLTTAKVDEFGKLASLSPQTYIVEATNINRYNRSIGPVKKLVTIAPLEIAKVTSSEVSEQIFIDTTGGASIIANISFPTIKGRDIDSYTVRWRVLSSQNSVSPTFTDVTIANNDEVDTLVYTTPPLNRGRTPGNNILDYEITPRINNALGFPLKGSHPLIGKQNTPAGVTGLNVSQQDNFLIFTWSILLTADGYVFDIDSKEVEIRQFPGFVDVSNIADVEQAWGVSIVVDRVPFPSTNYASPINVFGTYTYLFRVRDTSDIESATIAASVLDIVRPTDIKVYKSYNERSPGFSYIVQDGEPFPTSNVNPEASFPSFSESINGGLILSDSSNTDNSNGSATGLSVFSGTSNLTTGTSSIGEYITQIRDMGLPIKGTVRSNPILSIDNPSIAYAEFYQTIIADGISDVSSNSSILVDSAFGGIGHILGFSNIFAAPVSYDSYQGTLTSGGPLGNVYAIRNPGQFAGDVANANSYALIAGVINNNSIRLGRAYFANGNPSSSNIFSNVTVAGNSYQLINLTQFGDDDASRTFLGPSRSIQQNLFFRYSTDNVFYTAAANGISGYPNHGNTNPFAFSGAFVNPELGWKPYTAGEVYFRYIQFKLELINQQPDQFGILLKDFNYEIDIKEKSFRKSSILVNDANGIVVDYSFIGFIENPVVTVTPISSSNSLIAVVSNISENFCNVQLFNSTGSALSSGFVNLNVIGI
jgi:hypothetical protein